MYVPHALPPKFPAMTAPPVSSAQQFPTVPSALKTMSVKFVSLGIKELTWGEISSVSNAMFLSVTHAVLMMFALNALIPIKSILKINANHVDTLVPLVKQVLPNVKLVSHLILKMH